jgi:hypothetical protein
VAKIKQVYGEVRFVPWIGRDVEPGEVIDVPDTELASYLEAGWEPADDDTVGAHQALLKTGEVTVGELRPEPEPEDAADDAAEPADAAEDADAEPADAEPAADEEKEG